MINFIYLAVGGLMESFFGEEMPMVSHAHPQHHIRMTKVTTACWSDERNWSLGG